MTDSIKKNVVQIEGYFKPYNAVQLMHDCRKLASQQLSDSLSKMMGQVDDALFELAEKAENNLIQSLYFDAMREVRIKKKDIETQFSKQFNHQCRALYDPEDSVESKDDRGKTAGAEAPQLALEGELSLIENNQLETSLAVSNMVAKIGYFCKDELFALNKRIGILLNTSNMEDDSNPLCPSIICNSFKEACGELDSEIKVKLIILKLFEKYVTRDLKDIYGEINTFLAQNNILPKISYAIRKNAEASTALNQLMPEICDEETNATNIFSTLQNLLQNSCATDTAPAVSGGIPIMGTPSAMGVLGNLTLLQQGNIDALSSSYGFPIDSSLVSTGNESILKAVKTLGILGKLSGDEDFTIDIVAMMFDYILDDKTIPNRMKAIIGRLQIPVLKAVLLDKTFFSKKAHPVRKLLDTLSQAAIGLDMDNDESVQNDFCMKAEEIVQRIVMEFDDDLTLFTTALSDLEAFLKVSEEKIQQQLEETSRLTQEKECLAYASKQAEDEIKNHLADLQINEAVSTFLNEHWHALLVTTLMRDDQSTEAWQTQLDTMNLLIWSVRPKRTSAERRALVAKLPELLEQLQQGMDLLSIPQEDRDHFLGKLANCHSEAVSTRNRSNELEKASPQAEEASKPVPTEPQNDAQKTIARESDNLVPDSPAQVMETATDDAAHADETADAEQPSKRTDILSQIQEGRLEVEEITLSESGGQHRSTPTISDDQSMSLVRNLKKGAWITFRHSNGEKTHEKLTWINSATGIFMFTNRCGENTKNVTRLQLANDFHNGIAELIEDTPMIDRAVSSMIENLKRA